MPAAFALPGAVELGALAIATTLGAMLFFSTCVVPLALLRLDADVAGRFIRALFPWHDTFAIFGSGLAAILCAGAAPVAAALCCAAALVFLLARQVLRPAIASAHDAAMADANAARRCRRLQRATVALEVVQFAVLILAFSFAIGSR